MNDPPKSDSEVKSPVGSAKTSFVNIVASRAKLVWNKKVEDTQLSRFQKVIEDKYQVKFDSYWDLHKWSTENYAKFWEEMWLFYGIISSHPYEEVVRNDQNLIDVEWFPGARLNYAENMLKFRDDHVALICLDEEGNEEKITYKEMYEEVKLYAAAFRKHGLKEGDRIACYMPHRKEPVFAMLAGASIGALWGGPIPFYAAKAASNIIGPMSPKFLLTLDRFVDDKVEKNVFESLPTVIHGISSIEKVIIVATKEESLALDLSAVEKSCFLHEFLSAGRNPDGSVPDLIFEQLPFDHPLFITFTSGTTGSPKGIVHSAGSFLRVLVDSGLHCNLSRDDVIFSACPVGWIIWNWFVAVLSLGATLILYNGFPYFTSRYAFWDILDIYKVSYINLLASFVDRMEKEDIVPRPGSKLGHLKMITIGTSPVKPQNFEYLLQKVKRDVFITCLYGATEFLGLFSGCDYNTPAYIAEIQVPALGVDLKCLDEEGNSVVGQMGEVVIATPSPTLPLFIWNDDSKKRLQELYLCKYPGMWCQNDLCWIDPKTRGIIVPGRSDAILNPKGSTFGSTDIYFTLHDMQEIDDSVCVPQYNGNGDQRVVLFVKMSKGNKFSPDFAEKVKHYIEKELCYLYTPEVVLEVHEIPYSLNNKKIEKLVMKIIAENIVPEVANVKNPKCLKFFCNIPELQDY